VETKGMFREDFRQRIMAVLHQLHRATIAAEATGQPLADTEFTVAIDDWPNFPRDGRELATFSLTRHPGRNAHKGVWLIPNFNFWSAPPVADSFQEMQARARKYDAPIAKKEQKLVWRRVDWTNHNIRGALLNVTEGKPWADVRKMEWGHGDGVLHLDEFCQYAYVASTEGRAWSSRLTHLLNCDSVPVLHDLKWMAHYYHLLEPDVSYTPVHRNFSDLPEKMEYYIKHPDIAQGIADSARTMFRERYTTPAATACY